MGLGHRLDRSALRTCTIPIEDIKYLAWYFSHQHLFGPHPSAYMPPGALVDITVQASQVEGGALDILRVPYDASLRQSLISTDYAKATDGMIVRIEAAVSFHDEERNTYTSSSYITLKWWFCGESLSDKEDFYITEDLPRDRHAMLRRAPNDADHRNKALPLFNKVQTPEEKECSEERRRREDHAHSAIRQADNQKIEAKTRNLISLSSKHYSDHT